MRHSHSADLSDIGTLLAATCCCSKDVWQRSGSTAQSSYQSGCQIIYMNTEKTVLIAAFAIHLQRHRRQID
jgi:hypothetical protein